MPRRGWTNWVGVGLMVIFTLVISCLLATVFFAFASRIPVTYTPAGQIQIGSGAAGGATSQPTATAVSAVATAVPAAPTATPVPTQSAKVQPPGCVLHRFGSSTNAPQGSLVQPGGDQVAYVCSFKNGSYDWEVYNQDGLGPILSGSALCPEQEMLPWGDHVMPQGTYFRPAGSKTTWLCGASGHFDEDP